VVAPIARWGEVKTKMDDEISVLKLLLLFFYDVTLNNNCSWILLF
jgi:hypothetical protein